MKQQIFPICGMMSPIIFIVMIILGGALRSDYSHISDTMSELFSPGSPNQLLLMSMHNISAILTILFGVGVLKFIKKYSKIEIVGIGAAWMIILMGVINISTASFFPQDAWGSPATLSGEIHKVLVGILVLLSILSTLLIGVFLKKVNILPSFMWYTFMTVGLILITGVFAATKLGTPIMGLTERITAFICLLWTFLFAFNIFLTQRHTIIRNEVPGR